MNTTRTLVDDVGRSVVVDVPPRRIVSLVPSLTETVVRWGLGDHVVGVTKYCIHPKSVTRPIPKIGGTKDPDLEAIRALKPDIVLANAEENRREDVEALEGDIPCWVTFPRTVPEVAESLERMGTALGCEPVALDTVQTIRRELHDFEPPEDRLRVAYLIWRDPYMSISRDTYIADVLDRLGCENVFADHTDRYFEVTTSDLVDRAPDRIVLPSEPYPFRRRHARTLAEEIGFDESRMMLVPGEDYCWFGSRTAEVFATHRRIFAGR